MTLKQLLEFKNIGEDYSDLLKRFCYDGLFWDGGNEACGCGVDDLMPCDGEWGLDCECAYAHKKGADNTCRDCDSNCDFEDSDIVYCTQRGKSHDYAEISSILNLK